MKQNKLIFPIICIFFFLIIFSCKKNEEKSNKKPNNKPNNKSYYDALETAERHFLNNKIDSAFFYYNLSKLVVKTDSSNNKPIYSLIKMSEIQQIQNDFVGSEMSNTEAVQLFNQFTSKSYKCGIYNSLGINYECLFNFDESLKYYKLALSLTETEIDKISLQNNISVIYMDKLDFKTSVSILESLLKKKSTLDDQLILARVLDNLGFCYFKINNPKSLDLLLESIKIKQIINDEIGLLTSYLHLSEYYKSKNKNLEFVYAKLALEQSKKLNCVDERLKSLECLIENQSGNISKNYALQHINLNDSIKKARQVAKNQFAKIRFDSKKATDENLVLKAKEIENILKIETQKNKIFEISIFGILIGSALLFFVQFLIFRNKKEKLKTQYQTETRISKKLHDELASDVFSIMIFADSQNLVSPEAREKLINSLESVYNRTRDISKENSPVETGLYFKENLKEMISQYNSENLNLIINEIDTINWNNINEQKKVTIYRVLQELLINLKKHSKATTCVIGFKNVDEKIQINFKDNGVGMTIGNKFLKNGLVNTENRIKDIKGKITFESEPNKGFKVMIEFPK